VNTGEAAHCEDADACVTPLYGTCQCCDWPGNVPALLLP
jgi:hypothetical protein